MADDVRRVRPPDNEDTGLDTRSGGAAANGLNGAAYDRRNGSVIPRTSISPINADRPVFTLSVAADLLGMHPRTLRIYEEENLVIPARTPTQRRRYSQNDIKRFQFIQHLTQNHKVNLAGVRIILDMLDQLDRCGIDYRPQLFGNAERHLAADDELTDETED